MDFVMSYWWLIGTVLGVWPGTMWLLSGVGGQEYSKDGWVNGKPDSFDWGMSIGIGLCSSVFVWPITLGWYLYTRIGWRIDNLRHAKERKLKRKRKAQDAAFAQMKAARKEISRIKREAYAASHADWTAAFKAADVRRIKAVEDMRELTRLGLSRSEAERYYDRFIFQREGR